uniref:N-acetylgalactosaminide beta-1,3-galactosyltransferase n=1 Tax=Schistocephalus solidus TaxID=70667 RepID=A0A0V0JBH8_SCHSO
MEPVHVKSVSLIPPYSASLACLSLLFLSTGEAVVAEEMRKKIRLFAFIVTTSKYAKQKSAYIKATWARRIERFLFLSNEDDSSLPAIKIVGEDKEQTSFQKVLAGLLFAYRHNLTYFDYFIKTEDDAYVVPENLRFLLRSFDSNDPLMMGHVRRF